MRARLRLRRVDGRNLLRKVARDACELELVECLGAHLDHAALAHLERSDADRRDAVGARP